ncbi:hypothetical protein METHB2_140017 [Candidatus Methylobacter favarea]|uniref:Uncharacterized protein n=1 Tax=Candidatus Methylobacter favarea TaxID=2707345 RepID=A0A8S0WMK7_9GAMM|nr:hypothetical protein METHB2_140017 [Candidatus Methylobacter favarea]
MVCCDPEAGQLHSLADLLEAVQTGAMERIRLVIMTDLANIFRMTDLANIFRLFPVSCSPLVPAPM